MIEPGCEIDENELMKINWAGLLIPTLRLSKIVINSLGKFLFSFLCMLLYCAFCFVKIIKDIVI